MIEGYLWSMAPRAWGYETAQPGARVCARGEMRAYLAIDSHARFGFLWGFAGFERHLIENDGAQLQVRGLGQDEQGLKASVDPGESQV